MILGIVGVDVWAHLTLRPIAMLGRKLATRLAAVRTLTTASRAALTSRRGRTLLLEFNRPEVLNAWNDRLFHETREALEEAAANDGVSTVVLTGRGRAFSVGADMAKLETWHEGPAEDPEDSAFGRCLRVITSFPKPLIAAVNGEGVGWGMTMLPHCDVVFMSSAARVRTPFTRLGLTAEAGSSITFPARLGWQNAAHVLLSSRWVSAAECKEMGLAFKVTEPEALLPHALDYAAELNSQPLVSLLATKRLLLAGGRAEAVMAAHRREMAAFHDGDERLLGGPANIEALRAFRERREPHFSKL